MTEVFGLDAVSSNLTAHTRSRASCGTKLRTSRAGRRVGIQDWSGASTSTPRIPVGVREIRRQAVEGAEEWLEKRSVLRSMIRV